MHKNSYFNLCDLNFDLIFTSCKFLYLTFRKKLYIYQYVCITLFRLRDDMTMSWNIYIYISAWRSGAFMCNKTQNLQVFGSSAVRSVSFPTLVMNIFSCGLCLWYDFAAVTCCSVFVFYKYVLEFLGQTVMSEKPALANPEEQWILATAQGKPHTSSLEKRLCVVFCFFTQNITCYYFLLI